MPRKSMVCPKCGSRNTVELVYGYLTAELAEAEDRGEICLEGCSVSPDDPVYLCNDCGYRWGKVGGGDGLASIKYIKASVSGHFGPNYYIYANIKKGHFEYISTEIVAIEDHVESRKSITEEDWVKMVRGLKSCDFEYWLDSYEDPGFCDGTQWCVEVKLANGEKIRKHGSNHYPGKWEQFCRMMSKLAGAPFA